MELQNEALGLTRLENDPYEDSVNNLEVEFRDIEIQTDMLGIDMADYDKNQMLENNSQSSTASQERLKEHSLSKMPKKRPGLSGANLG